MSAFCVRGEEKGEGQPTSARPVANKHAALDTMTYEQAMRDTNMANAAFMGLDNLRNTHHFFTDGASASPTPPTGQLHAA